MYNDNDITNIEDTGTPVEPTIDNPIIKDFVDEYVDEIGELPNSVLKRIYNRALYSFLDLTFPYEYEIVEIPKDRPRAAQWVKDCMKEIVDRNGITALSYKENGVSISWSTDMISKALRERIMPLCG